MNKRRTLEEQISRLKNEIHMVRSHLIPQLEHTRADFGELINYFEAKFNELEQWCVMNEPELEPKPKSKNGRRKGKRRAAKRA